MGGSGGHPFTQNAAAQSVPVQNVPAQPGYGRPQHPVPPQQSAPPQQPVAPQPVQAQQPQGGYVPEPSFPARTSDELGVRETSGVDVRIASSRSERHRIRREQRGRAGRRKGLLAGAGLLVVLAAAVGAFVLMPGSDGGKGEGDPSAGASRSVPTRSGPMPKTGTTVSVATADGDRYQLGVVDTGTSEGTATQQTTAPSGYGFAYVEYVLSNPGREKVLLDFPGDVFVKRSRVESSGRARCMPQVGAPEDMCTPPTHSDVVRSLRGGQLVAGDGDDKYMPPGSAYLVRATVDVPVEKQLKTGDLRLFIWKRLYMGDQDAKEAPLPR
ncbi:hypothetical protein DZF91_25515 [Actinomadura logoneensis]|uniref:DUF4352 domain-containing protein n=1 Tax=Actinomadura logoneensis TaxID=2293572 RepID=A0A372JFW3_9ACTN|nr:hypothetical protein [Actinomadura logoneensis]RFU38850.1 hypothetical protein DZF91_25515 [Actinomadura logoneensis]